MTGIPKVKHSGLAGVVLGGEGLSATVASAGNDRWSVLKVKNVVVKVNALQFHIYGSKHDMLYNILATGLLERPIQSAFFDAITTDLADRWCTEPTHCQA